MSPCNVSFYIPESPQGKVCHLSWMTYSGKKKKQTTLQCLIVEIRAFIRQMEYTPTELNKLPMFLQESETTLTVPQVNLCLSFFSPFLYNSRSFIVESKYLNCIIPKCKLWGAGPFLSYSETRTCCSNCGDNTMGKVITLQK